MSSYVMKSNKQKRLELDAKRHRQADKQEQKKAFQKQMQIQQDSLDHVAVNRESLAPDVSFDVPAFVSRGHYIDQH